MNQMLEHLLYAAEQMAQDRLDNYVIAGLSSSLLTNGKVRLFSNERNHLDYITPHSHRYHLISLVLKGEVKNTEWVKTDQADSRSDLFEQSTLLYTGKPGEHDFTSSTERVWYRPEHRHYEAGKTYVIPQGQIHSIEFSKGARVLCFEGETTIQSSLIIEPVVNNKVIPTYKKFAYMFTPANK